MGSATGKSAGFVVIVLLMTAKAGIRGYQISQVTANDGRSSHSQQRVERGSPEPLTIPEEVLERRRAQATRSQGVLAHLNNGDHEAVLAAADEAIQADPENAEWYLVRGTVWENRGDSAKAIADYETSSRLAPDAPFAHQKLAWILATSPDDEERDGKKAVEHAMHFMKQTTDRDWKALDAAAAAFAEDGNFEMAIVVQRRALQFAPDGVKSALLGRLTGYEAQQPFRGEPGQNAKSEKVP